MVTVTEADAISIPREVLRRSNIQILHVQGDSMLDDHLLDGDQVIVEHSEAVKDGDLVVASTRNGETFLGRVGIEGSRMTLEPLNQARTAVYVDEDDVTIRGVALGILRKY